MVVRSLRGGQPIGGVALGAAQREAFGAPYYVIHRADLQTLLLDAVRGRPNIRLLVGRDVTGYAERADGAALTLESASGGRPETFAADLVVGADGVRSRLRGHLDGQDLRGCRAAAWRAIIPREAMPADLDAEATGLWLGPERHVVHYPLRGGQHVNVVAVIPERTGSDGWGQLGEPAVLRARFRDAAPALASLLAVPDSWLVWSLVDRPAARPMARGRLALLGDAAHPILPFLAQGAALAIEDSAILAQLIGPAGGEHDLPAALTAYGRARMARVRRVRAAARANGRTYHAGALVGRVRNVVMRRLGTDGMNRRYAWLYGWTP